MIALALKIVAGVAVGLIYKFHYQTGDTFEYFNESSKIATYLAGNPLQIVCIYFDTCEVQELTATLKYSDQTRALFFVKVVSIFYLLTGGSYWLIGAYFSFISFVGIYLLVKELQSNFPNVKSAAIYAFYFLPTFVFWSSGLLKESLAIACLCVMCQIVLKMNRTSQYQRFGQWILFVFCLWILWKLKYYYAAVALPFLLLLFIYKITAAYKRWRPIILGAVLLFSIILISNIHYNLNLSRVLDIIYENYLLGAKSSSGNYIRFYHFDGSLWSFILNLPLAIFSGLFRPLIGETNGVLQFMVATENLSVVVLLIFVLMRLKLLDVGENRFFVFLALIFVFSMASFLAFSTPNFGTLSRYKVGYWPFVVYLLLTTFSEKQKGQNHNESGLNYKL